jgi:hypothetical protein
MAKEKILVILASLETFSNKSKFRVKFTIKSRLKKNNRVNSKTSTGMDGN